jgi:hypothetical protein
MLSTGAQPGLGDAKSILGKAKTGDKLVYGSMVSDKHSAPAQDLHYSLFQQQNPRTGFPVH